MNKLSEANNLLTESRNKISSIATRLESIADSFYVTGNNHIGDKLTIMAETLDECSVNIDTAIGLAISAALTESFDKE